MTVLETLVILLVAIVFLLVAQQQRKPLDVEYGETRQYILKTNGYKRYV